MGPLEKLRARLFNASTSKEPACIPAILLTTTAAKVKASKPPQQHPLCSCMRPCTSNKASGLQLLMQCGSTGNQQLVWTEARRTHSAPSQTQSRAASDASWEPSKETDGLSRELEEADPEDDDVFFEVSGKPV